MVCVLLGLFAECTVSIHIGFWDRFYFQILFLSFMSLKEEQTECRRQRIKQMCPFFHGEGKRRKEFAEWYVEWPAEWHNYAKYDLRGK